MVTSENTRYANVPTRTPRKEWLEASNEDRLKVVKLILYSNDIVDVIEARENGEIILRLNEPLGPDKRGTVLLDIEELLKNAIDKGLYVMLEALGDKNSLRNLRGIEVKS